MQHNYHSIKLLNHFAEMMNENREKMRGVKRFVEYQPVVRKSQRVEKRSNDKKRKVEEKSSPGQRLMKSRRLTASPSHPPTSPPLNHPNPPPPSPSPKSSHSAHSIIHPSVEPSHISLKTSVNPSGPDVQRVKRLRTQPDSAHPTSYQVPATPLVVRRARRRLASRSTPPTTTQDTTPDPSTTSRLSPQLGDPLLAVLDILWRGLGGNFGRGADSHGRKKQGTKLLK